MIGLLSWLFPLLLLPRARRLGAVSFQTVEGVGWVCSIRPPHDATSWQRRGLNSWTGQARTIGLALRAAMAEQASTGQQTSDGGTYAPKLGGAEFDVDE